MAIVLGYKELAKQLAAMGAAAGGKALQRSAQFAIRPAVAAARQAAPVGDPPYHVGAGIKAGVYGTGEIRTVDPYPRKTYKGRLVTPGFARRSVASKVVLSKSKNQVTAMIGVKPEAFYAVSFVELGTSKTPKQPWLEPSFRGSVPEIDKRFQDSLRALIDAAAKNSAAKAEATVTDIAPEGT